MAEKMLYIQIRVSEEDKEEFKKRAAALKMSISQYIIFKCLVEGGKKDD